MLASLADLHHYAEPADRQLLDTIQARAAANKAAITERLARDSMARAPRDEEPRVQRRPEHDRMAVGE